MRSGTPRISSEFLGGGRVLTPQTTPRYATAFFLRNLIIIIMARRHTKHVASSNKSFQELVTFATLLIHFCWNKRHFTSLNSTKMTKKRWSGKVKSIFIPKARNAESHGKPDVQPCELNLESRRRLESIKWEVQLSMKSTDTDILNCWPLQTREYWLIENWKYWTTAMISSAETWITVREIPACRSSLHLG